MHGQLSNRLGHDNIRFKMTLLHREILNFPRDFSRNFLLISLQGSLS